MPVDMFAAFRGRPVRKHLVDGQRDVFVNREPGQQGVILKHDAAVGARAVDRRSRERDGAAVGREETRQQAHERRLAGAGIADDGDKLALLDREVDVAEHLGAGGRRAEAPVHGFDFKKRHRIYAHKNL